MRAGKWLQVHRLSECWVAVRPYLAGMLLLVVAACTVPSSIPEPTATMAGATECIPTLPQEGPVTEPYLTVVEPFDLVAPSGNRIYGLIRRPDPATYPDLCFAAVVMVPGGINPGRMMAEGQEVRLLAEAGMVVLTFNAEGRVDDVPQDIASEGTEDHNGFRHQDGLCAIVQYAIDLGYVIPDNVGIKTQSYGITMGVGCAARHPEIPIKYIVDGEGPSESFVTCHEPFSLDGDPNNDKVELVYGIMGHYSTYRDSSPENLSFWEEREALRFIGDFRGRYLRLQAEWDHAQPPSIEAEIPTFTQPPLWWHNKHTTDMVNAAVAGGVPWVRVNLPEQGNPVNATYDMQNRPFYLPGELADAQWGVRAVLEMARMP
ncbi:MAG: hypothetical protein PVJ07_00575 [Anaerolineales bacterium]